MHCDGRVNSDTALPPPAKQHGAAPGVPGQRSGDRRSSPSECSLPTTRAASRSRRAPLLDRAHEGGRNVPRQESCGYPPRHVLLGWEAFPVGNAHGDSYRGINLPARVCPCNQCTYAHVFLALKEEFCCVVAQRARTSPEHSPQPLQLCSGFPATARFSVLLSPNPARAVLLGFIALSLR